MTTEEWAIEVGRKVCDIAQNLGNEYFSELGNIVNTIQTTFNDDDFGEYAARWHKLCEKRVDTEKAAYIMLDILNKLK